MKITLNHPYRYAVEQMSITLFPDAGDGEVSVRSTLSRGAVWVTARTVLDYRGTRFVKVRRAAVSALTGGLTDGRVLQKIIKLSFYDAGVAALGAHPPWGALTGVRPAKLAVRLMDELGAEQARRRLAEEYHVSPGRVELLMDCAGAALRQRAMIKPRDIGLYIGIPFCPTRCAYCSFISADVGRNLALVEPFVDALLEEIDSAGRIVDANGLRVTSVYMGGGTPTVLTAGQLDRVLGRLRDAVDLSACAEVTVEAGRPDTVTAEKLAVLRRRGTGRVSVNPQTMRDEVLRTIERGHSAEDSLTAHRLAREAGFEVINMDVIAGLPGDSPDGFRESLDAVLALAPENITVHTLSRKRGAALDADAPSSGAAAMLDYAAHALRGAGYGPYYLYRQKFMSDSLENVGWCKPERESAYNIRMMEELCSVLALGGGGVTKLVNSATGEIRRHANPKYPKEYIETCRAVSARKEGLIWP